MARTKIVCTIGPASECETVLRKMIFCGMDVARLNFSHGDPEATLRRIRLIRKLNKRYRKNVRFLGDLEGPRIRIGSLKDSKPVDLIKGRALMVAQGDIVGDNRAVSFDYKGPLKDIKKGAHVYIDDGNIALVVTGHSHKALKTKVVVGGQLKEHKGVNIPEATLRFGPISCRDIENIRFCVRHGVDYVAQSFVRTRKDIHDVRKVLLEHKGSCGVIAKIENREGINNIDDIIDASDGIMVARGDMGVSVPIYEIPIIQKMIIRKCNKARKFVITATQMLESMTENRIPTRAEVTDVANAIIDGTDYVMLSAESAAGKHPVEAVDIMNKIIRFTEDYLDGKARI